MKRIIYYLRLILPVILVIFILSAKPSKVKGQDSAKVKTKTEKTHIAVIKCEDGDIVKIDTVIISSDDEDFDFDFDTTIVSKNCNIIKLKTDAKGHAYIITTDGDDQEKRVKIMKAGEGSWTILTEDDDDDDEEIIISIRKKDGKDGETYIMKKKSKAKAVKKEEKK